MPLHADEHGDPTDPKVVLVHGFTQTRRSWQPLLPRLAQSRHVLAVDAPASATGSVIDVNGASLVR